MRIIASIKQLGHLDLMIRRRSTGSPSELAQRMHVSERHIYRIIEAMKDSGFPIEYCPKEHTYQYVKEVSIQIEISADNIPLIKINTHTDVKSQ